VTLRYSYVRGSKFYFQRPIPKDLQDRYNGAKLVKVSLGTSDVRIAARKIEQLNKKYEAEWTLLRASPDSTPESIQERAIEELQKWGLSADPTTNDSDAVDLFRDHLDDRRARYVGGDEEAYWNADGSEYLSPVEIRAAQLLAGAVRPTLSDALDLYLKVHPKRGDETFVSYTRRAFATLTDAIGDKPLDELSREDAHAYVTKGLARGNKSGTIRRRLNTIKAVVETYFREKEIDRKNPFASVPIPTEGNDEKKRQPFTDAELATLFAACKTKDDDVRWLIAILGDTGARLAEIAGLTLDDLVLHAPDGTPSEIPHVIIRVHPWRSLKNDTSARTVPLLGHALWAAQRVKETAKKGQRFAFPRYTSADGTKATHASNTIAKWMRSLKVDVGPDGLSKKIDHTAHELRHTMADRLREVGCPPEIRLAIGGWTIDGIGATYGKGYTLRVMSEWLSKVVL
jgi:integrase